MRFSQSFVVALLAGAFGLVPMNVVAQNQGFLVLPSNHPKQPTVHVVTCRESNAGLNCAINTRGEKCKPGECSFQKGTQPDYPGILIYGVSGKATCAWMYDTSRQEYYAVCW